MSRAVDGFIMEGTFADGEMQGHWVWRKPDGSVTEGPVVDGRRHGYWVRRQADGTVFEGSFAGGRKHGRWVMHNVAGGSCMFSEFAHGEEIDSWELPTDACPPPGVAANQGCSPIPCLQSACLKSGMPRKAILSCAA